MSRAEEQLKSALIALSHVWHFAGGTLLVYETTRPEKSPRYTSNAEHVEEEFLSKQGKKKVYGGFGFSWSVIGSYRSMPLRMAATLCCTANSNAPLKKMLRYYYEGLTDRDKWFMHIYKVRDAFCKVLGKEDAVRCALGISPSDWSDFGRILNNYDLRHPEISGSIVTVPKEDIARARLWLLAYLRYLGMSIA